MSTEAEQRARVVAEARTWLATPYRNCADIRGVGVDCGMLIVRVFVDTGLCPPFDPRPYPPDWHLHRSDERYLGFVGERTCQVEEAQPGDVMVFKWGRCYSHGGIVVETSPLTIVHALASAGTVVEEQLQHNSRLSSARMAPRVYSLWAAQ